MTHPINVTLVELEDRWPHHVPADEKYDYGGAILYVFGLLGVYAVAIFAFIISIIRRSRAEVEVLDYLRDLDDIRDDARKKYIHLQKENISHTESYQNALQQTTPQTNEQSQKKRRKENLDYHELFLDGEIMITINNEDQTSEEEGREGLYGDDSGPSSLEDTSYLGGSWSMLSTGEKKDWLTVPHRISI